MNDTMIEAMSRPSFVLHLCSVIVENRRRSRFGIDKATKGELIAPNR